MGVSHLDLTAVSRAMREAAAEEDLSRLDELLDRFRFDLLEHALDEAGDIIDLRGVAVEVVLGGQQGLLEVLGALVDAIETGDARACRLRAVELDARLRRQVRLEATVVIDGLWREDQVGEQARPDPDQAERSAG